VNPQRSAEGLASEYLFHDGRTVVWTEGGAQAEAPRAADVQFWRAVFAFVHPGKVFYFKPYGGKATLLPIAHEVSNRKLRGVIVCMDRDHDDLCGKLIIERSLDA